MIKNTYPGKFIVIEGLDGSGKSVQVDLLANYLKNLPIQSEKSREVILESEPTTDSEAGIKIRKILKGEIKAEPIERQEIFVQDRTEHLENKIIPALKVGKFVLCSRYAFSTIAYGYSDGLDVNVLIEMNRKFLLPDATIVIDVSPAECIKRIERRGQVKELFEREKKLIKVNEVYKKLPTMFENIFMVNGEKSVDEVFEEVKKIIEKIL